MNDKFSEFISRKLYLSKGFAAIDVIEMSAEFESNFKIGKWDERTKNWFYEQITFLFCSIELSCACYLIPNNIHFIMCNFE